ncbi:hypothetical protein F5B20DRAFT_556819 [Whalleya microplaca]|nr:hypothetical protein F5B20DRAFT_556819 [Whalleya microplaca]
MGLFDRIKWARNESSLATILQRLQSHKSSLSLMLTIMQSDDMQQVHSSTIKLPGLIEEILHSHQDLASRISRLEREGSVVSRPVHTIDSPDDKSSIRSSITTKAASFLRSKDVPIKFAFERDLEMSRVYNRNMNISRQSLTSVPSTALHTTALSFFSDISLSQISHISFYVLPVYANDLSNSNCYVFGQNDNLILQKSLEAARPKKIDVSALQKALKAARKTKKTRPSLKVSTRMRGGAFNLQLLSIFRHLLLRLPQSSDLRTVDQIKQRRSHYVRICFIIHDELIDSFIQKKVGVNHTREQHIPSLDDNPFKFTMRLRKLWLSVQGESGSIPDSAMIWSLLASWLVRGDKRNRESVERTGKKEEKQSSDANVEHPIQHYAKYK